ncbi:NUDIX hydrolase [Kangiella sp. TOML190]|uniref:NUDIX hydrolase n=1 Tax=Kangiella sp. TOML190 TaxID=2931351 RepID=UPI00203A8AF9|nr:NUDIX hydrolase [Kangiella sp. TOML190]
MLPVHVTVAAVIEGTGDNKGRFLMVEETASNGAIVFNQPAGHLEENESLQQAIVREVFEETGLKFKPTALVGTYLLNPATNNRYYLRFCFTGYIAGNHTTAPQDDDIIAAHWMSKEDILAILPQHRSGLILDCLKDYLSGQRFPLELLPYSNNEEALQQSGIKFLTDYKL